MRLCVNILNGSLCRARFRSRNPGLVEGHRLSWVRWNKGCKPPASSRLEGPARLHPCQEDSNLLAQDRSIPSCYRSLENAAELGRSPGELNRVAESNCAREPTRRLGSASHASRRRASGSNGTIDVPAEVQRMGVRLDGTEGPAFWLILAELPESL